ncbi:hypothetical protein ACFIQF_11590 [Comamonas sp. J-3]|uniref:hypothetical protein n=1 Tax=Comamonas trifloxystrobinivorans TaxID=3350256 RepID=UPI00372A2046
MTSSMCGIKANHQRGLQGPALNLGKEEIMDIERKHGPFTFASGRISTINGTPSRRWSMYYGNTLLAEKVVPGADLVLNTLFDAFEQERSTFVSSWRAKAAQAVDAADKQVDMPRGYAVRLVRSTAVTGGHGKVLSTLYALAPIAGLSRGLIDDRFDTWAVSDELGSVPMGADEFARLKEAHEAIGAAYEFKNVRGGIPQYKTPNDNAWIASLLPDDVLTDAPEAWRAPTSWELRHVVGEGSFTGVTGAKAAELVGVTPQNFRKYTAADDATTRQKISFAMWHLLLHKLGVQAA